MTATEGYARTRHNNPAALFPSAVKQKLLLVGAIMHEVPGGLTLSYTPETPFDSIEGAHQYIELLLEAIEQAQRDVEADIRKAAKIRARRQEEALLLVAHNLNRLSFHISRSRRLLNDLRTLRRLLLEERVSDKETTRAAGAE